MDGAAAAEVFAQLSGTVLSISIDTANLKEITLSASCKAINRMASTFKPSRQQLSIVLSSPAENSRLGLGIDAAYPTRLLKPGEPSECLCASRKRPILLETREEDLRLWNIHGKLEILQLEDA